LVQGQFSGLLTFETNSATANFSIPIFANITGDVGVGERLPDGLSIFPSPASENLFVEWSQPHQAAFLEVLDTTGKKLFSAKMKRDQKKITLGLHELASGSFVLKIRTKEGAWSQKFLKE
jgi:hypothetical protein